MIDLNRKPSCDVNLGVQSPPQKVGDINLVPSHKIKLMQDYAKKLRKKHPLMKEQRLTTLVCRKFNVKLV